MRPLPFPSCSLPAAEVDSAKIPIPERTATARYVPMAKRAIMVLKRSRSPAGPGSCGPFRAMRNTAAGAA